MNSSFSRFIILSLVLLFVFRFPVFSFLLIVIPIAYIVLRGRFAIKHFSTNQGSQNVFEQSGQTWNESETKYTEPNTTGDFAESDFDSRAFTETANSNPNNDVFEAEYTEHEIR